LASFTAVLWFALLLFLHGLGRVNLDHMSKPVWFFSPHPIPGHERLRISKMQQSVMKGQRDGQ
jgi:hypothetical protein